MNIDLEFKNLIPPLTDEERSQLEESIIEEGCRDALVVWAEQDTLLDGHNRFEICYEYRIPYSTVEISLPNRQAAINWIINNQLGRRNLTPTQASYLRGKRYQAEKTAGHGAKSAYQNDTQKETAERLADEYKVSAPTIKRDGQFAAAVDALAGLAGEDTRQAILMRDTPYTKQDILSLAKEAETNPEAVKETLEERKPHVSHNSGNNEWYTPPDYIEAARAVMGRIDLDPASSKIANEIVKAAVYFTAEDDGLRYSWDGRVWMNPPYASELISKFCDKLAFHYSLGDITEAITLVNNATETNWFASLVSQAAAVVFPQGRVRFRTPSGEAGAPLQGQAILYMGDNPARFLEVFTRFGWGAQVCKQEQG